MLARVLVIFFWIASLTNSFSQAGSVRVQVLNGGNLDFIFNSISKYKTGITYTNYTRIGITVNDNGNAAYVRWELTAWFEDADGDNNITGTNTLHKLPFSTVEASTSIVGGCGQCKEFFPGPPNMVLTNAPQVLIDGNALGGADDVPPNYVYTTDQIDISYYCGTSVSLMGEPADYYSDDINLEINMYDF